MKLQIGMPVYNGSQFIAKAINSILNQTFTNWNLVISDNASTDATFEIISKFAKTDPRIKVVSQKKNIGMLNNFEFVFKYANSEYFMWAAADDVWKPNYIEKCLNLLETNKNAGLAFTDFVNINAKDKVFKNYKSINLLLTENWEQELSNFILDEEYNGKANLFYGIYRREICREVLKTGILNHTWGADMAFVTAVLCRCRPIIYPEVLFLKRVQQQNFFNFHLISHENFDEYAENLQLAAKGTIFSEKINEILLKKKQLFVQQKRIVSKRNTSAYLNRLLYLLKTGLTN